MAQHVGTPPHVGGGGKEDEHHGQGFGINRRNFVTKIIPGLIVGLGGAYAIDRWEQAQRNLNTIANLGSPAGSVPSAGGKDTGEPSAQPQQTSQPKNAETSTPVDLETLLTNEATDYATATTFDLSAILKRVDQIDAKDQSGNHVSMIVDTKPDTTPDSAFQNGIPVPLLIKNESGQWVHGFKDFGRPIGVKFGQMFAAGPAQELRDNFTVGEETNLWQLVQPDGPDSFSFNDFLSQVSFAHFAKITDVRMMHLVWASQGAGSNLPKWLDDKLGSISGSELQGYINNYITTVMTTIKNKYGGLITEYSVVNEPYWEDPFMRTIGQGYIASTFQTARDADPSAKLILNWYNNHWPSGHWTAPTRSVLGMLHGLVDKVGMQSHIGQSSPLKFDRQGVIDTVESYKALGVEPIVTEWDVDADRISTSRSQGRLYKVAFYYRDYMDSLLAAGVNDISFWDENSDSTPFNALGKPNPAKYAIQQSIYSYMMNGPAH